jgi:WD40 repeat protein
MYFLLRFRPSGAFELSKFSNEILMRKPYIAVGFRSASTAWEKSRIIVHIYSIGSNAIIKTLSANSISDLLSVQYSPDGKYLAMTRKIVNDNSIILYTTDSWSAGAKDILTLGGQNQYLSSTVFSPDSKLLVTTTVADGKIRIWDVEKRTLQKTYTPNLWSPGNLKFLSNTRFAVACMYDIGMFDTRVDTTLFIWNLPHVNTDIDIDTVAKRIAVSSGQGLIVFKDEIPSAIQFLSVSNINEVLSPNPVDGMTTLNAIERKYTSYQMLDNTGKVISEGVINGNSDTNSVRFYTASLSRGVYFIRLRSAKETKTLKLVKE